VRLEKKDASAGEKLLYKKTLGKSQAISIIDLALRISHYMTRLGLVLLQMRYI
jgi:hypothetical protein